MKLDGNFNASSAQQLLYYMRMHCDRGSSIVIDTGGLNKLEVFGLNLFRYQLKWLKIDPANLLFIGAKQSYFMDVPTPEAPMIFNV